MKKEFETRCANCIWWQSKGLIYSPTLLNTNNYFHRVGYCRQSAPVATITHDRGKGDLAFTTVFPVITNPDDFCGEFYDKLLCGVYEKES